MHAYLHAALQAIDETAGRLDAATIARAGDDCWSVAQILEHLTLAFNGNTRTLEKALASGEVRGRPPGFRNWFGRILVIEFGYFPRVKAPERTVPTGSIPPERSVAAIRDALQALDAALSRVSARFGDEVLVANHPFFMGLTVPQWRKFHWRHTIHHMRQIDQRVARPAAPQN